MVDEFTTANKHKWPAEFIYAWLVIAKLDSSVFTAGAKQVDAIGHCSIDTTFNRKYPASLKSNWLAKLQLLLFNWKIEIGNKQLAFYTNWSNKQLAFPSKQIADVILACFQRYNYESEKYKPCTYYRYEVKRRKNYNSS